MMEEQKSKINIQWFPGHMTKAKRQMEEHLKLVDMVIELRDARIPNASKNPLIEQLTKQKPRLILLTKRDKAQPEATRRWVEHLQNEQVKVLALDLLKDPLEKRITSAAKELMKDKLERMKRRGIRPRAIRAMVVGIPNVGKSTLINSLAHRRAAVTGDRPGVTKALQWVKIGKELELLDTPGVLWPKFEDAKVGMLLAVSGAIRDDILPLEEIDEMEKWEGSQLNKATEILAYELTNLVHGEEEAKKAQEGARALFAGGADTANMPSTELTDDDFQDGSVDLISMLVKTGLVPTRSEGRRAIEQGGVSIDGEKITDIRYTVSREDIPENGLVLKRGKKKFHKVLAK